MMINNKDKPSAIRHILKFIILGETRRYTKGGLDSIEDISFCLSSVFPNKEEEKKYLQSFE